MKVFIVEDDVLTRASLEEQFLSEGCDVLGFADTLASARDMLADERPDLTVLDLRLAGGESGVALLDDVLRDNGAVVILTGAPEDVSREVAERYPVLAKPLPKGAVARMVETVTQRQATI